MAASDGTAVVPTDADLTNAIVGLGNKLDTTYATDAALAAATVVADAAAPKAVVLTADFDVDSGTTGATPTATGLTHAVGAGETYVVRIVLQVTATTNGGVEVSFDAPGSSTFDYTALIIPADDTVSQRTGGAVANPINYIAAALSNDPIYIDGVLTTDSAGSFTILGAQDTAHVDNTLIETGSFMTLIPVA